MNFVKEYYKAIKSGEEVVPEAVRSVYEREVELMERKDTDFFFDEDEGLRPIEFVTKFCKQSQGIIGAPLKLELFQKAKYQLVYGWKEKDTGFRRFREVGDVRGRKCGKSTETAGVELYSLIADSEGAPEIYCVANKIDQAKRVFTEAVNMRQQSSAIRSITKKRQNDIYFPGNMGYIKAIASDVKTMDGLNAHFFSLDEWHEARNRGVYDKMKQSGSTRNQPLAWLISSFGFFREGFFDTQERYYQDIALGVVDNPRILPLLYTLDKGDDWTDPKAWPKANPGLGAIKKYQTLHDYVEQAKADPSFLPTVLTQDFNVRQNAVSSWLPWEAIVNKEVVDMEYLKNSYAIGGCDLSATIDLTCATLLIRKKEDNRIFVLQNYFIPESKIKQQERQSVKEADYRLWSTQGWLTICNGSQVNYSDVTQWFVRIMEDYNIRPLWICYDAALSGYWTQDMEEHGFDMQKIRQGPFTWTYPMKEMGAAFADHLVVYQNNPMLRWCLNNTCKKSLNKDGIESIQPVKITEARRIDGTVSLLNAWVGYNKFYEEYMHYVQNTRM